MTYKFKNRSLLKKKLQIIFDSMIPGDKYLPSFTNAVNVDKIIEKYSRNQFIKYIKKNKIDLNEKKNWDKCTNVFGNEIIESYFTSKLVVKALNIRKKNYLKNKKKKNVFNLIRKVKFSRIKFIK